MSNASSCESPGKKETALFILVLSSYTARVFTIQNKFENNTTEKLQAAHLAKPVVSRRSEIASR